MTTLNTAKIESNNETFTRSDYNGVSILIRDKDGYINATKIAKDNDKQKRLNEYFKSDKWKEICSIMKNISPDFSGKTYTQLYYKITTTEIGGKIETYGTYVHPDLVHFVAEWCNIEYAFKVNIIMNEINKLKEVNKKNGNEYLNKIITELKDKNEYLRKENIIQKTEISELKKLVQE